jgi:hypothetical protein
MAHGLEIREPPKMGDIVLAARKVVVHAQYIVPPPNKHLAQMTTDETGTA